MRGRAERAVFVARVSQVWAYGCEVDAGAGFDPMWIEARAACCSARSESEWWSFDQQLRHARSVVCDEAKHLTRTSNRTRYPGDTDPAVLHDPELALCRQTEFVELRLDCAPTPTTTVPQLLSERQVVSEGSSFVVDDQLRQLSRLVFADEYGVLVGEDLPRRVLTRHMCHRPVCVAPDKLTDDDVIEIRARREAGEPRRDVAAAFGVHEGMVTAMTQRRTWRWLP